MNRLITLLKREFDLEIFSCTHCICMIFLYGVQLFFAKIYVINFLYILEMLFISYFISVIQNLLFKANREYTKGQFITRTSLWLLLPPLIGGVSSIVFDWYQGLPFYSIFIMVGYLLCYHIFFWVFLRYVFKEDTIQLNVLLRTYQEKKRSS